MPPVRVAVVGLGFGRNHVAALEELAGRAELVAVVDPTAPADNPRLAGTPELPAILAVDHYRSLTELLSRDVPDVVALATPIHTHFALGREALAAGAHVLLEKPPTATLGEFHELVAAAQQANRAVQIGFQARGGGGVAAVRAAVAAGEIGEVTGIGVVGPWVRTRGYFDRAAWAGRRVLDGVTVMDGVVTNPLAHAVDVALVLDGTLTADDVIDVAIDGWRAHDIEADDTTSVIITTARGTTIAAGLTVCSELPNQHAVVTVHGTRGALRLFYKLDRVEHVGVDGSVTVTEYGAQGVLENLVEHVAGRAELLAPVAETGAFMRVLEAVRTSGEPGEIADQFVTWEGEGPDAHPVVADVDAWCRRVASEGRGFTDLGAPWTR